MSNIFARLLEEGDRQQRALQQPPQTQEVVYEQEENDSTTARQQTVETARHHDTTTARQHDSIHDYVDTLLKARATNKTTLRYPLALMNDLDEVVYQIKRTYGVVLSKNEIFVLALASTMHDFKRQASRSLIYTKLIKDQEKKR